LSLNFPLFLDLCLEPPPLFCFAILEEGEGDLEGGGQPPSLLKFFFKLLGKFPRLAPL
jgi:hypothetical protein